MEGVVGGNEELEVRTVQEQQQEQERVVMVRKEGSNGLMKWGKFFPKMALRVLLVEADDSTRQIIVALLKKCSYRVAAVADGLKAWEILKGRPHSIDLILTEVDLPAISGYALLTLIMEHDVCKNIPVIMMSSQDSISMVYKCMMRGASDYLVKPIRKNELRNLWQHVWRRQSLLVRGNVPQDESVGQDKVEATSENNAASNHSNDDMVCVERSKEYIEKGSDAQSSSTKPDVETENVPMEYKQDIEQPAGENFSTNNMNVQSNEAHTDFNQKFPVHDRSEIATVATRKDSTNMCVNMEAQHQKMNANVNTEACHNNNAIVDSPREAIDFMGASNNHNSSSNINCKFDYSPHLDLSLRRSHPFGFEVQASEERHILRHSDASAFTRYTNKSSVSPHSKFRRVSRNQEFEANSEMRLPSTIGGYSSDVLIPPPSGQRCISLAPSQAKECEITSSCPQKRIFPIQVPVEGVRFNNACPSYGSAFPPVFSRQSGASPTPSPSALSQREATIYRENSFHPADHFFDQLGHNANDSINQCMQKNDGKLDSLEDRGHISPTTDQSTNSNFCNASHLNGIDYGSTSGSNSNVDQVAMVKAAMEGKTEDGTFTHNVNSHRSIQREAALNKFRLRRKNRCYEKKVRYESRKKLAEQRPRVKGQFVRQVQTDQVRLETN